MDWLWETFTPSEDPMHRHIIVALLVLILVQQGQQATAQQNGAARIDPVLWKLLDDWATGSSGIRKLHGKHVRRAYIKAFEQEKVCYGEFWYEAPDRGRIDMKAVEITEKMVSERQSSQKVRRGEKGQPYELISDIPQRWICDGKQLISIDDKQKEAQIHLLPPEMRGDNIMNSPLPFLFGLPPEKATKRFELTLAKDYRPAHQAVIIKAKPLLRMDSSWKEAQIILNTETWLPSAVQLKNADKSETTYTFRDMEVNKREGFGIFAGRDPYDPRLGKEYNINLLKHGAQASPKPAQDPKGLPKVVSRKHDEAKNILVAYGVKPENIKMIDAGPAPRKEYTYRVLRQSPDAGAQVQANQIVKLFVFNKPKVQ